MPEFVNPFSGVVPGRKLTRREALRAARLSIAAEEEAVHLYEAIADASDDPLVKRVMQDIADEERVHVGEFQQLIRLLQEDEESLLQEGAEEVNELAREVAKGAGPGASESPAPSVGNLKQ